MMALQAPKCTAGRPLMPVCCLLALVSVLQLAAMRSRGRGEAARAAALATAGGPLEPTEQQLLLQRVSKLLRRTCMP
jgi:hypothetical protein